MKKAIKFVLFILIVLVFSVVLFNSWFVKNSINTVGPQVLGVPVSVEKVRTFLLMGRINIKNLVIGNPDGFKTDNLFKLNELVIRFKPQSLLTGTIIINEISVISPEVTYEMSMGGSNIGALQERLAGDKKEEPKEEEEKPGKKIIIEKFVFNDGQVNLSLPGMMGTAMPIPLPAIEMKDIGKEDGGEGASFTDVIGKIFGAIFSSVTSVVTSSGKLIGDGAAAVGGAAADAGKAVGKGVADAVGDVIGIFGVKPDESAEEKKSE